MQARQYCRSRVTGLASSQNMTLDKTAAIPVGQPSLTSFCSSVLIKTLGHICLPLYEKRGPFCFLHVNGTLGQSVINVFSNVDE